MKKPYLDRFQRMVLTKAPDTLYASQLRLHMALKILERELSKSPLIKMLSRFVDWLSKKIN